MKILRTFLLLLLCAVLPISGLAASGLTGDCDCPMQMSMGADEGSAMSAPMSSCETMKSPQTGKAKGFFCKTMAQCQLGCMYLPAPRAEVTRPAGLSSPVVFHYAQSLPVREPAGLWRPPRAI